MSLLLCLVLAAHDGDTLTVQCQQRAKPLIVRVAEIDAPEFHAFTWGDQPGRLEALAEAKAVCPVGGPAKVRLNLFDTRTKRWIAHIECAGVDLSSDLAEKGLAWPYITAKKSAIPALVKGAQDQQIGLWAPGLNSIAPAIWRKNGMHQSQGAKP